MREFETSRLRMRTLEERNADLFLNLYTDPEIMRYIAAPLSVTRARREFRRVVTQPRPPQGPFFFVIEEVASEQEIGLVGVVQIDRITMHAEVGIVLKSECHGRGCGREGLAAMAMHAFEQFPLRRVWVQCSALNPAVERMVASVGFMLDDPTARGTGRFAQREWSLRRASEIAVGQTNQRGEGLCQRSSLCLNTWDKLPS